MLLNIFVNSNKQQQFSPLRLDCFLNLLGSFENKSQSEALIISLIFLNFPPSDVLQQFAFDLQQAMNPYCVGVTARLQTTDDLSYRKQIQLNDAVTVLVGNPFLTIPSVSNFKYYPRKKNNTFYYCLLFFYCLLLHHCMRLWVGAPIRILLHPVHLTSSSSSFSPFVSPSRIRSCSLPICYHGIEQNFEGLHQT